MFIVHQLGSGLQQSIRGSFPGKRTSTLTHGHTIRLCLIVAVWRIVNEQHSYVMYTGFSVSYHPVTCAFVSERGADCQLPGRLETGQSAAAAELSRTAGVLQTSTRQPAGCQRLQRVSECIHCFYFGL